MTKREKITSLLLSKRCFFDQASLSAEDHYLTMAKMIGIEGNTKRRSLDVCEEDEEYADQFMREHNLENKKVIGLSVAAGKPFKEWGLDNYAQLKLVHAQHRHWMDPTPIHEQS